jgi:hypothetical protein
MLKDVYDNFTDFDSKKDTLGVTDEQRALLASFEMPDSGRCVCGCGGEGNLRAGLW